MGLHPSGPLRFLSMHTAGFTWESRSSKQTGSSKENTGLWLKCCFQGRAIPVPQTCQITQSVGFERQSVINESINAPETCAVSTLTPTLMNCRNQSRCRALQHTLVKNHHLGIKRFSQPQVVFIWRVMSHALSSAKQDVTPLKLNENKSPE